MLELGYGYIGELDDMGAEVLWLPYVGPADMLPYQTVSVIVKVAWGAAGHSQVDPAGTFIVIVSAGGQV